MDKGYFNSNILKLVNDENKTISQISVDNLINPNRVDVVIKAIYAKHYKNGTLIPFIVDLYTNHINCINGFVENDESKKIGKKNFVKSFHSLIDDISRNGFHTDTILPVGKKNVILDGAHRLSTQLGKKVYLNIINLDNADINLDFTFFKNRGLKQIELDYTAAEYAKLDSKSRVIIIWPLGKAHERELLNIFNQYGEIIYRKDIKFNLTGVTQLVRVAYSKEKWLGNIKNDYAGARNKARWCFADNNPLRSFLFNPNENSDLLEMKEKIRNIFSLGKHPIHINDTHDETIELANFLFNDQTINWANKSRLHSLKLFDSLCNDYKRKLKEENYDVDDFLVVGSTLSVFGVKDCKDFDYINTEELDCSCFEENSSIEYEKEKLSYLGLANIDLIYDPNNYFIYNGVKFLSLKNTIIIKENRRRDSDINDLVILKRINISSTSNLINFTDGLKLLLKLSFWRARIKMFLLKIRFYIMKVLNR